ncbi:hypothetical protein MXD81_27940 [Microbacteriaceae bacterium K1510]|nr:hypothetical protein [Microbacteriaceae bacterium K1510]
MIDLSMLKFMVADSVQLLTLIVFVAGPIALLIGLTVWLVGRRHRPGR